MAKLTANQFVHPSDVAAVMAEGLDYSSSLAQYVLTNHDGDSRLSEGDYVNFYIPSLLVANERDVRGTGTIVTDDVIYNDKRAVKLDKNIYKAVPVSDAEMTLDVTDFARQVVAPITTAIARSVEQAIAKNINGASYKVAINDATTTPHIGIAQAMSKLTEFLVPVEDRVIVIGTGVQAAILTGPTGVLLPSGNEDAHRRGIIGSMLGAPVVVSPFVNSKSAFIFHRSAFPLITRVPRITESSGPEWQIGTGAVATSKNVAIAVTRERDTSRLRDLVVGSTYIGTGVMMDKGKVAGSGLTARFTPFDTSKDIAEADGVDNLIRAIKITYTNLPS